MDEKEMLKALEGLGLPEKAAALYLVLLGAQKMGVAELARESGVKRATCYEYLDLLLKKDFVTRVPVGKRVLYAAAAPSKALAHFRREARRVEEALGELEARHDEAVGKPKITFYEGKREIKRIYAELFTKVGDAASIFPPEAFFASFTEEEYDQLDQVISGHVFTSRDLFVPDKYYKKIREIRNKHPEAKKTDKKLPDWFKTNVDVLIFSDKVALISLRDLSAIVIENADIAELFRSMHTFMWKGL